MNGLQLKINVKPCSIRTDNLFYINLAFSIAIFTPLKLNSESHLTLTLLNSPA